MNKNKLTFICVQPAILYYAWQVEVMLENFKKYDIHKDYNVQILLSTNPENGDATIFEFLKIKYKAVATFFYYPDTRLSTGYVSSIRPNVLKQHFYLYPELNNSPIFYHDCDMVFTKKPDFFAPLLENDLNWYVSNTISYIGYEYINSKEHGILDEMSKIVGINSSLIKAKENQSGGAQYLLKNVDWTFWDKVEKDSENLFIRITSVNNEIKKVKPDYHELQIWTADMWAILWNAWLRGFETNIIPELEFCWADENINNWENFYIYHNAGITKEMSSRYFYKSAFTNSLPYNQIDTYDTTQASYKYFEMVKQLSSTTCLQ